MSKIVSSQRGNGSGSAIALLLFVAIIAAGVWAVYSFGEGHVVIGDRTVSELEPWEVIGGVIAGFIGLIIGLAGGLLGIAIGLVATVIALVLGFLGVAAGLFITAGTLLGPFLLIAAIVLLMRRNKEAEVSQESVSSSNGDLARTDAAYWS